MGSDIGDGMRLGISLFLLVIAVWGGIIVAIIAGLYWWLGPIGVCI